MIQGEYRRDEKGEDDDRDEDDWEDYEYEPEEAKDVFEWIVKRKDIAESIRDFTDREDDIISDLLAQMGENLSCSGGSGDSNRICGMLTSSLSNSQKSILKNIKDENRLRDIARKSSSDDELSAIYEITHNALSNVCEDAEIDSLGSDHSYKACLSWIYFCGSSVYDLYSKNQIDQYLLKDTYRAAPESSLTGCNFLSNEPKWSNYWD